jgi:DNA-binding FadR family transcriptional regulator
MLKAEHHTARSAASISPIAKFVDRRRQAQIAARHALQRIAAGLASYRATPSDREREIAAAIHAAELQLPESWLPFVVSQ